MSNLNEKIYYNALNIATNSNFSLMAKLKDFFGSFEKVWEQDDYNEFSNAFPQFALDTIQNFYQQKQSLDPLKEWQKLEQLGDQLILKDEENYPPLLKEIPDAPLGIYQKGTYDSNLIPLAIVGTRKPTSYGKTAAEKITKELAERGFLIISGLAYGIDTIAHQTALENKTQTIAILGSGVNIIFPQVNKKLAEKIIENGALISEYPLDTPPLKHHFPARNRIISGLAYGTVVIEAPIKSGSLITARFALEQNREVFAVPGSIFSPNSEGVHQLIKSGAKLVHIIDDILEELTMIDDSKIQKNLSQHILPLESLTVEEKKILDIIKQANKPLLIDEIVNLSQLDVGTVNQIITLLELKNLIKLEADGYRLKF